MQENDFIVSLNEVTSEELGLKRKEKKGLFAFIKNNFRKIFVWLCALTVIGCGGYVISSIVSYAEAGSIYEDIYVNRRIVLGMQNENVSIATPDYATILKMSAEEINGYNGGSEGGNAQFDVMYAKLYFMTQSYPDVFGWVTIPGTNIDYPIMQAEDNDYYLRRSYSGVRLLAGSIFADYRNSREITENHNLILYGHHMTSRLMFHDLDNYLDEEFFNTNNLIYIYTLKGIYTYKVISAYQTTAKHYYIKTSFTNDSTFATWANDMISNSVYNAGVTFKPGDKMITLSTCTNLTDDGRLCIEGILIDVYEKGE